MRRDALIGIGMYDESLRTGQDTDLWVRLRDAGSVFRYIPEPLLKYRLNPNSVRVDTTIGRRSGSYRRAHLCVWNSARVRALAYWHGMNTIEKIKISLKVLTPSSILRARSIGRKRRAWTRGKMA